MVISGSNPHLHHVYTTTTPRLHHSYTTSTLDITACNSPHVLGRTGGDCMQESSRERFDINKTRTTGNTITGNTHKEDRTKRHPPEGRCDRGILGNGQRVTLNSCRIATRRACVPTTCSFLRRHRSRRCTT